MNDPDSSPPSNFFQAGPELDNQYRDDAALRAWLQAQLPAPLLQDIAPGLERRGGRACRAPLAPVLE